MADRAHHVLDHLPEHGSAIRKRIRADPEFRSLCEDYGEAFEALRRWEDSAVSHRAERIAEFRRLVGDLEAEILAELGAWRRG